MPPQATSELTDRTDRELLEAMVRSQMRVEEQVTAFLASARPALDMVSKRGIMGLMGMGK